MTKETKSEWRSAKDPKTGKTYYYHVKTRETQWRKPKELASDEEKRKMAEKEMKQKDFFASMEANIMNSLAQGIVPGTLEGSEVDRHSSRTLVDKDELPEIERTISSMDETVLRDLIRRQPSFRIAPQKMESINSNLGGFESILRDQPNRLASVSELFNSLPDESISEEDLESVSGRSDAGEFNKSLGQGFGLTWEETQALKKLADIAKEMTDGENDDEGKHSNDLLSSLKTKEANKGTPMLSRVNRSKSRGPSFQKAKDIGGRELDFDTSDDDSDNEGEKSNSNTGDMADIRPEVRRRNTCGTMYVKTTMSAPDKDATIKCVCGIFRTHILTSEMIKPEIDDAYKVFNDLKSDQEESVSLAKPPTLDEVTKFYREIFLQAQMEADCIIMSLIYVEKLIKKTKGSLRPRASNWRSLIFSCMILSSKVWDDLSMWNVDFSQSGPEGVYFSLKRINELELSILKALGFEVKVLASEYAKYYFLLRSMLIKSGLGGDETTSPLDIEGARRLQEVSSQFDSASLTKARASIEEGVRSISLNPNLHRMKPRDNANTAGKVALEQLVEL